MDKSKLQSQNGKVATELRNWHLTKLVILASTSNFARKSAFGVNSRFAVGHFEKAKITQYNIEYRLQLFFTFLNYHRNRIFLYFLVNYRISIISLLLEYRFPILLTAEDVIW